MTNKEIEKKAEKYANEDPFFAEDDFTISKNAFINGAKSRDCEIEELKAQIDELKAIFEIVCKERYGYAWEMRKSDLIEKLKRRIEK